jgi:RNA polymerase sigma factor (sigma-70 family)
MTTVSYLPTSAPGESPSEQFDRFYRQYAGAIQRFLYRHAEDWQLAEDLTQEVFAELWKLIESPAGFDEHVGSVRALLYQRARWALARHYKKMATQREYLLAPSEHPRLRDADQGPGPETVAADRVHVGQVLALLTPDQRRAVALYYLEDLAPSDIAELCRIGRATVDRRLNAAKAKLREHFGLDQAATHADAWRERRETATEVYRQSVADGAPLSVSELAHKFGSSFKWAHDVVRDSGVRPEPTEYVRPKLLLQLRTRLAEGAYPADRPLPAGLALAEQFGVSSTVMRKALLELASEGLLRREGSLGNTVRYYPANGDSAAAPAEQPAPRRTTRPRLALAVA